MKTINSLKGSAVHLCKGDTISKEVAAFMKVKHLYIEFEFVLGDNDRVII